MGIEVADNGRGTAPHLASALLGLQSGAQFLEVHYPGGAQAMQATLGGQTKMMVETYNVVAGNVQGGKMRVLASMGDRVEPGLEQFPLAIKTVPGAVAYGFIAAIAKKGVDAAILTKLNKDMVEALLLPEVVVKERPSNCFSTSMKTARPGRAFSTNSTSSRNKWLQAAEFHAANCRNIRVAYKPAGVQCLPGDIA